MKIFLLFRITFLLFKPSSAATTAHPSTPLHGQTEPAATEEFEVCQTSCEAGCWLYDVELDGGLCKCDADCEVYGDCCGPLPYQRPESCEETPSPNANLDGLQFTCQSIFLDNKINVMKHEAFWMVSSCSVDWIEEVGESGEAVLERCISETRDLPPVTDTVTGVVYKNQHCALCNRVEKALPWQASIVCTDYLYQLLSTTPISELNVTILQEQCQVCSYQPPNNTSFLHLPRACYPTGNSCLGSAVDIVDICENGPYNLQVSYDLFMNPERVFRNRACADCNEAFLFVTECLIYETSRGRNQVPQQCVPKISPPLATPKTTETSLSNSSLNCSTDLECLDPPFSLDSDGVFTQPSQGIPFNIFLSNLARGDVVVITEEISVKLKIDCPEGQAAVGLECKKTVCPRNFMKVNGGCFSQENLVGVSLTNQTMNGTTNGSFLGCPLPIPLNDTEFTPLSNNTVLVDGKEEEVVGYSDNGQLLICPDNYVKVNITLYFYPIGFIELTYIGCSLSVIGSALVLITYGLFKELRSLPSKILMNLAFANLVTNLLILIGGPVSQAFPITQFCIAVAILLHFFSLAQFAWMSVMSFEVARKFHQAKRLIEDTERDKFYLLIVYTIIAWGLPLLITAISVIVNFTATGLVLYGVLLDNRQGSCWINHRESALVAFVVPLIVAISFNFVMFIIVTIYIIMAARSQAKLKKEDGTPFFRLNVTIFCTTGLTWIFGFIAILAGGTWAWYLFIIFNSIQGFVIFIAFLFKCKILTLYLSFFSCKKIEASKSSFMGFTVRKTNSASIQLNATQSKELK